MGGGGVMYCVISDSDCLFRIYITYIYTDTITLIVQSYSVIHIHGGHNDQE